MLLVSHCQAAKIKNVRHDVLCAWACPTIFHAVLFAEYVCKAKANQVFFKKLSSSYSVAPKVKYMSIRTAGYIPRRSLFNLRRRIQTLPVLSDRPRVSWQKLQLCIPSSLHIAPELLPLVTRHSLLSLLSDLSSPWLNYGALSSRYEKNLLNYTIKTCLFAFSGQHFVILHQFILNITNPVYQICSLDGIKCVHIPG